jgi:hypothetical protein
MALISAVFSTWTWVQLCVETYSNLNSNLKIPHLLFLFPGM